MTRRILLVLTLLVAVMMPSYAVYDEKNVDQSIHVLKIELKDKFLNIGKQNQLQRDRTRAIERKMIQVKRKSSIVAMMLYSQKVEYIFGMTYASDMAADMYTNFVEDMGPLLVQMKINENDVARCNYIINVMNNIDPAILTSTAKKERLECIYWCNFIKVITAKRDAQTKRLFKEYKETSRFLYTLNQYAYSRYDYVQKKMFNNGSETFLFILQHWDERWPYLKMVTLDEMETKEHVESYWSVSVRLQSMLFFGLFILLAIFLGWVISLLLLWSKSTNPFVSYIKEWLHESRMCFIVTCAAIIFALTVNIIRLFVTKQTFLVMSLDLMGVFSWIVSAIFLSAFFTSRKFIKPSSNAKEHAVPTERAMVSITETKAVQHSMYLYLPMLFCSMFVIFLRINFFPNLVVAFTLPPVVFVCTLIEPIILGKVWKRTGQIDRILATLTELVFVFVAFCSWNGYILLTVQILTWWLMQLTCILILTSIGIYMKDYGVIHNVKKKPIAKTWLYYFVCMVFCPIGAIYSSIMSAYWAGDVFSINELVTEVLDKDLLGSINAYVSLRNIINIANMWFIARFLYFVIRQVILKGYNKHSVTAEQGQNLIYVKVLQIAIYGIWFIAAMVTLKISMTWIAAGWAGLVTGMGFASKTILENIFYGVSLLSGRLKIGDLIRVGDVYGKVLDISYSSTVIKSDDGTVVAFTNQQLMDKNYRNLTLHNEFNKHSMTFNVDINEDIERVRRIVLDATLTLPCLHLDEKKNGKPMYSVTVKSVGVTSTIVASYIMMKVDYWVDPYTEKRDMAVVTECVINALRNNNIALS